LVEIAGGGVMNNIDYDKLADAVAKKLAQHTLNFHPDALWTPEDVALYLRKSKSYIYQSVISKPDFPAMIRIDSNTRHKLYRAGEVMAWVTRPVGRPRKAG
jgi:hypothetical protein